MLEYLIKIKSLLKQGTLIGITWSNNGVGTKAVRAKIQRDMGKFEDNIGMVYIDKAPNGIGYGDGGNMNVMFYKKVDKDSMVEDSEIDNQLLEKELDNLDEEINSEIIARNVAKRTGSKVKKSKRSE